MPFEPGKIQTYVGTGEAGYAGDGGPADQAVCTEPFMCDFDSSGNLFTLNREITSSAVWTRLPESSQPWLGPAGRAMAATAALPPRRP